MGAKSQADGCIRIIGACQNNLKDIQVGIPANRLTVITGVSGSGKSSLAFDILYAEGQRRYVESLSSYARQFLERIQKPQVREIVGIRPAISIRQRNTSRNPRSTVGTVTEIYDYLRLLYARVGTILCRGCGRVVRKDTVDDVVQRLARSGEGRRIYVTFPFAGSRLDLTSDRSHPLPLDQLTDNLVKHGFHRLILGSDPKAGYLQLPRQRPDSLEALTGARVLVDRLRLSGAFRERLTDSIETCFAEGNGVAEVVVLPNSGGSTQPRTFRFTERLECQYCRISYTSPEPGLFSFNNAYGACPTCHGFGNTISLDPDLVIPDHDKSIAEGPVEPFTKPRFRRFHKALESYADQVGVDLHTPYRQLPHSVRRKIWAGEGSFPGVKGFFAHLERKKYKMHVRVFISRYRGYTRCPDCEGKRLCREARDVHVGGRAINQLTALPISEVGRFFSLLELSASQLQVAEKLLLEIRQRLGFLVRVGLGYLTLDRLTYTLSGGEMQRIHLAASLGSSLVGTLYILDEPSVGLHARDERMLIEVLERLRDLGNTIVVVEHEKEMIEAADHIIDMGPGAGEQGGEVIHSGDLPSLLRNQQSMTGKYLTGRLGIPTPVFRRSSKAKALTVHGARQHNLQNLTLPIPLGVLVCVTGVSGSGKSTLVHDVLYSGIRSLRGEWKGAVGEFDSIEGWESLSEILMVDQAPIGKTPRSNPVTYLKAFATIRQIFASLREAQARGLTAGSFSFNLPGGRCETCQGAGRVTVQMQFLADVELICEECKGTRYQPATLEVRYKGKNIAEVLEMTVSEALTFFRTHLPLVRKLKVLRDVGLGYLRLGQSATTLSGGEAQRIKLSSYLVRKTSRQPLFIFDEPTTGLHFHDIHKLLKAFDRLTAAGASVLVIEHNLDVIKCADWIIDLGPEGGDQGGRIVAQGRPEEVARVADSHTGRFLRQHLNGDRSDESKLHPELGTAS
ncbi:MAG: excinuclease ABC subunit UvrA [Acidobacteriota bacterium]